MGIDSFTKKKLLPGVKQAKLKKYVHCLAGKQRGFFSESSAFEEA